MSPLMNGSADSLVCPAGEEHLEREAVGWAGRAGRASRRFVYVAREQLEAAARLIHEEPLAVKSHQNKHLLLRRVTAVHPPAAATNSPLS